MILKRDKKNKRREEKIRDTERTHHNQVARCKMWMLIASSQWKAYQLGAFLHFQLFPYFGGSQFKHS